MDGRLYSIFSLIFFAVIFFASIMTNRPGPAIFILVIFLILLTFIGNFAAENSQASAYQYGADAAQRRAALQEAKIFLAPYNDIWRDLRLSNKYCSIILGHDGVTIKCIEKVKPYRKFQITETFIHTPQELWNLFCVYFSHNKSYDGVMEDCYRYHASTIETIGKTENVKPERKVTESKTNEPQRSKTTLPPTKKLDINNCSEIELTELPGISIVIAKKAIRRREEIGGFKSVDEFLNFIKLKPHMENQLRELIKTEKMKGSLYQKKYNERSVDF